MNTFIAILRGINVSGKNIIKMQVLKDLLIKSGFANVQTYIQSGNIVFQTRISDNSVLEQKIRDSISGEFGFSVPVMVLKNDELRKIIDANPFLKDPSKEIQFLHITFLSDSPDKEKINILREKQYGADEFEYSGKVIYLYCPSGYGNTKLTNTMLENKLKVTATTRNLKTSQELLKIAENLKNS